MDNETKIKKVLFNEISLCLAGIGVVSSVMFWVMNPQQTMQIDIVRLTSQVESYEQVGTMLQKFKDNDLHELQIKMDQIETRQIELLKAVARIDAKIN